MRSRQERSILLGIWWKQTDVQHQVFKSNPKLHYHHRAWRKTEGVYCQWCEIWCNNQNWWRSFILGYKGTIRYENRWQRDFQNKAKTTNKGIRLMCMIFMYISRKPTKKRKSKKYMNVIRKYFQFNFSFSSPGTSFISQQ